MKIAVVGAGFTGLTAAYRLSQAGHYVDVFETYPQAGGFAGYEEIGQIKIERFYHHIFKTDKAIINLAKELGVVNALQFRKSKDAVYLHNQIYPLNKPSDLFFLRPLSWPARIKLATSTLTLKLKNYGADLENYTAKDWLIKFANQEVYEKFWQPLLIGKFGPANASQIAASWFWARVKVRTRQLGYFNGGFETIIQALIKHIGKNGGHVKLKEPVVAIESKGHQLLVKSTKEIQSYNKVIYTAPLPHFKLIVKNLPQKYIQTLEQIRFLHAQCLVLISQKPLMPFYWLNIADTTFPFLLVVEHTNFAPIKDYGGWHIIYIGNYLDATDWRWQANKEELLVKFWPFLQKINPQFTRHHLKTSLLFRGAHAQPIITQNYHQLTPPMTTPLPNLYLATMAQVYPFDRGTNFAVWLGQQVAELVLGLGKQDKPNFT